MTTAPRAPTLPGGWRAGMQRMRPMYEAFGAAVTAAVYNVDCKLLKLAAQRYDVTYKGPKLGGRGATELAERVAAAKAWLAAGGVGLPGAHQVTQPAGQPPGVQTPGPDTRPRRAAETVTPPTARITRAPTPRGRYEAGPDVPRVFSGARPGVDPLTMEAWR